MLEAIQLIFAFGCFAPILALGLGLGCGCHCVSCSICSDDFTRSNSTDIDTGSECGWDEDAGDGEISSNNLITTSSNAKFTCQATHPDSIGALAAIVVFQTSITDEPVKVWIDEAADTYVQLTTGTSKTLKLVVAGVDRHSQTVTTAATTSYTLTVVQSGDGICSGRLTGGGLDKCVVGTVPCPETAVQVAIGTGASIGGTVTFESFTLEKAWTETDTTCRRPCYFCELCDDDSELPIEWEVEIEGLSTIDSAGLIAYLGAEPDCGDCESLNASYILQFRPNDLINSSVCVGLTSSCNNWTFCSSETLCEDGSYCGGPLHRSVLIYLQCNIRLIAGNYYLFVYVWIVLNPMDCLVIDDLTRCEAGGDFDSGDITIDTSHLIYCVKSYPVTTTVASSGARIIDCDDIPDEIVFGGTAESQCDDVFITVGGQTMNSFNMENCQGGLLDFLPCGNTYETCPPGTIGAGSLLYMPNLVVTVRKL